MVRRRVLVLVLWTAVTVAGTVAGFALPSLLVNSLNVPGSASQHAESILARHFGQGTEGSFVVAFRARNPSPAAVTALQRRLAAAARKLPGGHATKLQQGSGVVYGDVATPLGLQQAERWTPTLRRALAGRSGPAALVTGEPALQYDLNPILSTDLHRGDGIALLAALLVLTVSFGLTLAVAVPFVFAAGTIAASLGVLYLLAHVFTLSSYAPNLAELIGLGLAIDYSLLVVHRFREELAGDDEVTEAVVRTMRTAGRATIISGGAVALGLLVVLVTPVPFVRSLGLAGLLVPLISVIGVLTLQPALLSLLGPRLASPGTSGHGQRRWERFASAVTRRPRTVLLLSTALLVACFIPVGALKLTPGSISAIPLTTDSARGLKLLNADAGPGEITPVEIVINTGSAGGAARPSVHRAVQRLADGASNNLQEAYITAFGFHGPYVDRSGRYLRMFVVGRHHFGTAPMQELVRQLRTHTIPAARLPPGTSAYVGGASAQGVDYLDSVYGSSLWFAAGVLILAFLFLLRAFRSLALAASAVLLNVLSALATLGLLVVIFRDGIGAALLGLYSVPQIEGWIPIFLVAMLFGLSMDYEVFLVMRMREAFDRGADTADAVRQGLARTGPVITAAAAIMIAAFCGFLTGRVAGLQEFGAGLAIAVALDATVVRLLLVPNLVLVLGSRAWWAPANWGRRFPGSPPTVQRPSPSAGGPEDEAS
jgi:RND superfamily putative drug exporter